MNLHRTEGAESGPEKPRTDSGPICFGWNYDLVGHLIQNAHKRKSDHDADADDTDMEMPDAQDKEKDKEKDADDKAAAKPNTDKSGKRGPKRQRVGE